ncbi:hypothetical protein [Sorangium sp. So ce394]|uniref:hypothetical protein n=1 Tax=Sorangium sp. So ce394 TaxID=3133310 RepID=UPI003F5B3AE4
MMFSGAGARLSVAIAPRSSADAAERAASDEPAPRCRTASSDQREALDARRDFDRMTGRSRMDGLTTDRPIAPAGTIPAPRSAGGV